MSFTLAPWSDWLAANCVNCAGWACVAEEKRLAPNWNLSSVSESRSDSHSIMDAILRHSHNSSQANFIIQRNIILTLCSSFAILLHFTVHWIILRVQLRPWEVSLSIKPKSPRPKTCPSKSENNFLKRKALVLHFWLSLNLQSWRKNVIGIEIYKVTFE